MTAADYFRQLAQALRGLDFVLLALKTCCFGVVIATVTCYYGLAQPLRLDEVSRATVRAVAQIVIICAFLDALFIVIYLVA
jgi:ABC-type transporter Mla maintaining outer membrane lipid asymmetry permease subunit MlaE